MTPKAKMEVSPMEVTHTCDIDFLQINKKYYYCPKPGITQHCCCYLSYVILWENMQFYLHKIMIKYHVLDTTPSGKQHDKTTQQKKCVKNIIPLY